MNAAPKNALEPYQIFCVHLVDLVAAHLEIRAPNFVQDIRAGGVEGIKARLASEAETEFKSLGAQQDFARYLELVNYATQARMSIQEVRVAVVSLGHLGESAAYAEFGISEAERFYHAFQTWAFVRGSLFERSLRLAKACIRRLPLKASASRQDIDKKFTDAFDKSRAATKGIRDAAAHGGDLLDDVGSSIAVYVAIIFRRFMDERNFYNVMWRNREQYLELCDTTGEADYKFIGDAFRELDSLIDWEKAAPKRTAPDQPALTN